MHGRRGPSLRGAEEQKTGETSRDGAVRQFVRPFSPTNRVSGALRCGSSGSLTTNKYISTSGVTIANGFVCSVTPPSLCIATVSQADIVLGGIRGGK